MTAEITNDKRQTTTPMTADGHPPLVPPTPMPETAPPPAHPLKQGGDQNVEWKAQLPLVTVLAGDCRDRLLEIARGTVDCVLMDPPYGRQYQSNRGRTKTEPIAGDDATVLELLEEISVELARVLTPGGHCFCFCDWRFAPRFVDMLGEQSAWWTDGCVDLDDGELPEPDADDERNPGLQFRRLLIWAKPRGMGSRTGSDFVSSYECVLWFVNGGAPRRPLHGHPCDLIEVGRVTDRQHPTEKPVAGLRDLIVAATQPGEVVLDPFAGSGSTAVASLIELLDQERRTILIERNEGHVRTIRERLFAYGPADALPEWELPPLTSLLDDRGGVHGTTRIQRQPYVTRLRRAFAGAGLDLPNELSCNLGYGRWKGLGTKKLQADLKRLASSDPAAHAALERELDGLREFYRVQDERAARRAETIAAGKAAGTICAMDGCTDPPVAPGGKCKWCLGAEQEEIEWQREEEERKAKEGIKQTNFNRRHMRKQFAQECPLPAGSGDPARGEDSGHMETFAAAEGCADATPPYLPVNGGEAEPR